MLNRAPSKYTLRGLISYANNDTVDLSQTEDGKWVPARPIGFFSIRRRFRYAWMVFTGKADIVVWPGDQ